MIDLYDLIDALEKSVDKNGDVVLTNKHLLNLLRLADSYKENEQRNLSMIGDECW